MPQLIFESVWIFLPAAVANMAPVFAARFNWLPQLARPISQNFLGNNKTWRGLLLGVLFGSATGYFQYAGSSYGLLAGVLLGFGALFGDAAKSFIKRRFNIMPGQPWPPWDQIDYVVGAAAVSWWLVPISLNNFFVALLLLGLGSYVTSLIGVHLRIKKSL